MGNHGASWEQPQKGGVHTDNYKLPYASKTGVDERNYQLILAEAFRTMKHDGPMLMAPRSRIRGRAWQYYKGGR